ncbi:hypothetical protein HYFRA_00012674 [Hymenoscyphus fraxineus]|uniref:Uncharacterized protein n=1 Tax=Hymenoscyphus fraxineus TaxID=746836 RepID=A0A9N9L9E9_9HELO|nr:hypothetical protein HYFRA_00012674 [Hymenoscyphus fraxineus]
MAPKEEETRSIRSGWGTGVAARWREKERGRGRERKREQKREREGPRKCSGLGVYYSTSSHTRMSLSRACRGPSPGSPSSNAKQRRPDFPFMRFREDGVADMNMERPQGGCRSSRSYQSGLPVRPKTDEIAGAEEKKEALLENDETEVPVVPVVPETAKEVDLIRTRLGRSRNEKQLLIPLKYSAVSKAKKHCGVVPALDLLGPVYGASGMARMPQKTEYGRVIRSAARGLEWREGAFGGSGPVPAE